MIDVSGGPFVRHSIAEIDAIVLDFIATAAAVEAVVVNRPNKEGNMSPLVEMKTKRNGQNGQAVGCFRNFIFACTR